MICVMLILLGHAVLGLRPDWQQQLKAVHTDLGIKGVRFHGSFDDDMGPVVELDAQVGRFTYSISKQKHCVFSFKHARMDNTQRDR